MMRAEKGQVTFGTFVCKVTIFGALVADDLLQISHLSRLVVTSVVDVAVTPRTSVMKTASGSGVTSFWEKYAIRYFDEKTWGSINRYPTLD